MASSLRQSAVLVLKGAAMGAADVVPGVSGGTIAFITGVYEELLASIKSVNGTAVRKLFQRGGIRQFWAHINGSFLLPLVLGIGISIASLASVITHVLKNYPVLIWAFFFGLIVASIFLVAKAVRKWSPGVVLGLLLGTAVSYYVTTIDVVADENTSLGYVLLCGMVAICAMILPGISGSFILLLMGAYGLIIGMIKAGVDALKGGDFGGLAEPAKILSVFGVGALFGLIAFSHVLTWLFKRFHDVTVALLIGFLVGSLNKVWPWKETLSTRIKHAGREDEEIVPLIQQNVSPSAYENINAIEAEQLGLTVKDPYVMGAIVLAIAGFGLIWLLEKFGPDAKSPEDSAAS